jgi:hypothetical protein
MALSDCTTYFFRELALRMEFHNERPFWEDGTGGSPYQWTPTTFKVGLCKTGDPGEAGDLTTNAADYTGYTGPTTIGRGATYWALSGNGGQNPKMSTRVALIWDENTGAAQDIHAITLAMVNGGSDAEMVRDLLSSPVTVDTDQTPEISAGQFEVRIR